MRSAFIYSERLSEYKLSAHHPYDPIRVRRVHDLCQRFGLFSVGRYEIIKPESVNLVELSEVHSSYYLGLLRAVSEGEFSHAMLEFGIGTEDCPAFPGLFDFISLCAGATIEAGRRVVDQDYNFAFNPMGGFHHAGYAAAEGFCYVNDICLVAHRWAERGLKVMVIDIDAHHGNGTQDFFYNDNRVLTVSFHESGATLYPYSGEISEIGEGRGRGFNVNIPMLAGSDDEIFSFAFNEIVPPLIKAFSPDVVIGVMGVDTFSTDPLTHLNMTNNSYIQAAKLIHSLSPRWIALGAGGYDLNNVARGWTLLWAAVNGLDEDDIWMVGLGGVFMSDSDLGVASLRDRAVRTSGPEKMEAFRLVEDNVEYIKWRVFPLLGAEEE